MSFINNSNLKEQELEQEEDDDKREGISIFPKNKIIDDLRQRNYDFENKFICSKCKMIPTINFYENKEIFINLSCNCKKEPNIYPIKKVEDYINFISDINYKINEENEDKQIKEKNPIFYFRCEKHSDKIDDEKGIYKFYCFTCKKNLCDICYSCHICEGDESKKFYDFLLEHATMVEKIEYIHKCLFENDSPILDWKESDIELQNNFKNFVVALIMQYYYTPDYTSITNLNNLHQIFSKIGGNQKLDIENNIEINSIIEYQKNESNKDNIIKIEIWDACFDINLLENKNFNNLKILNLGKNNIDNIKPLTTVKFDQLVELNLTMNKLSNDMNECFSKLNFPELKILNLSYNYISNYEIFKSIEHFKKLIDLNLCSNFFNKQEDESCDENIKYIFKSLENIVLSNGVFSEENIGIIIKRFEFEKLKSIDLSSNHLRTLSFIKYLKNYPIETLILNNNEIKNTELNKVKLIETLSKLEIRNNAIEKFDQKNYELFDKMKIDFYENKVSLLDDAISIKNEDENIILTNYNDIVQKFEEYFK